MTKTGWKGTKNCGEKWQNGWPKKWLIGGKNGKKAAKTWQKRWKVTKIGKKQHKGGDNGTEWHVMTKTRAKNGRKLKKMQYAQSRIKEARSKQTRAMEIHRHKHSLTFKAYCRSLETNCNGSFHTLSIWVRVMDIGRHGWVFLEWQNGLTDVMKVNQGCLIEGAPLVLRWK